MSIYDTRNFADLAGNNPYVGRGIIVGKTPDGKNAVTAYFIMGRSENSRNRIFVKEGTELYTRPFEAEKVEDPSLIIYAPVREYKNKLIVTNGDQTDTVYNALKNGKSFFEALRMRAFEPDRPNFTPRISAMLSFENNDFTYLMSILKSQNPDGTKCARYGFEYEAENGLGHFLHTYTGDGNPLPTFCGEPERTALQNDIDTFTGEIWNTLDKDNRISLYVRYTELETKKVCERIINKNVREEERI